MSKRPHAQSSARRVRARAGSLDGGVRAGSNEGSDGESAFSRMPVPRSKAYVLLAPRLMATAEGSARERRALEDEDEETRSVGSEEAGADTDMELDAPEDASRAPTPPTSRLVRKRTSMVYVDLPTRTSSSGSFRSLDRPATQSSTPATRATRFFNGLMTPPSMTPPSARTGPEPDVDLEVEPDPPALYVPPDDEIEESGDLVELLEEAEPDEDDQDSDDEDAPIRDLDDFALYDPVSLEMIPFWDLVLGAKGKRVTRSVIASGMASPRLEEDSDEEDNGDEDEDNGDEDEEDADEPAKAVRVKLGHIIELNFLWWYPQEGSLDKDIWIRTRDAWYVLREPAPPYLHYMRPFSRAHYVVYDLTTYALRNVRASLIEFFDDIDFDSKSQPADLGSPQEYENVMENIHVQQILYDLPATVPTLGRTYIYRHLDLDEASLYSRETSTSNSISSTDASGLGDASSATETEDAPALAAPRKRPVPKRKTKSKNPELQILKHEDEEIVLTPVVRSIAQQLRHLKLPRMEEVEAIAAPSASARRRKVATVHARNPETIVWGPSYHHDDESDKTFYKSVRIDGVQYKPGDLVMVEPGDDDKQARADAGEVVHTTNPLAQRNWFARIEYLHDGDGVKSFHARWFSHSSKTLLQELSHPSELFWIKECADPALACILQKCTLEVLPVKGAVNEEAAFDSLPNDHFFTRNIFFDEDCVAWTDMPPDVIAKALAMCPPHAQCVACGLNKLDDAHESFQLLDDGTGIVTAGITYHQNECIYLYGDRNHDEAYELAQLLSWDGLADEDGTAEELTLSVRHFHRHDDLTRQERAAGTAGENWRMDERHIFLTGREETVKADRLAGKFFLRRREPENKQWLLDNPDVFYCTHGTDLAGCDVESAQELRKLKSSAIHRCEDCFKVMMAHDEQLRSVKRLRGLEIFAGAGGLSEGFKSVVDTRYHIEFSSSCGLTLQANHPDAVVYVQDCNKVLKRDLETAEGIVSPPLLSLLDNKELPPLPGPGEVDIIYGGPPCQSFSSANHYKKEDDPRSMLALVLLSFVERQQSPYVVIENVVGFADYKTTLQDGRVVNNAMLKIIPRIALALGYQVHGRILQAAQLGVAQGRRRFIYILARRGIPLPQHPLPTHVHSPPQKIHLPTGTALRGLSRTTHGFLTESSRSAYYETAPSAAPHSALTIEQAIGDLPKFHWRRPGVATELTKTDRKDENERIARGEVVLDAVTPGGKKGRVKSVGFLEPEPYGDVSRSHYQDVMRESSDEVTLQYTRSFQAGVVERVTAVPLVPGANWKDLPKDLPPRIRAASQRKTKPPMNKMLLRLHPDGVFSTSMTDAYPLSKTSGGLHYDQRRTLTLREGARAQGFPDHYKLCSVNEKPGDIMADQQRQIGNAVPVPFARALAEQSLRPAVLAWQQQTQGDESD